MKVSLFAVFLSATVLVGCSTSTNTKTTESNLYKFAYANCLFQYFSNKGYDTESIRNISGGLVAKGEASPEKYQSISEAIAQMDLGLDSKAEIDASLNKCFHFEKDEKIMGLINQ